MGRDDLVGKRKDQVVARRAVHVNRVQSRSSSCPEFPQLGRAKCGVRIGSVSDRESVVSTGDQSLLLIVRGHRSGERF